MSTEPTSSRSDSSKVVLAPDTPLDYALSAGLWAVGLGWMTTMMGVQIALHRVTTGRRIHWMAQVYTLGQVLLTGSRWQAVVDPAIDPARPYFFFQNHINHLDHCTMYCATPHFKQGVELEKHFKYPIYGAYMRGRGTVPVNNESAAGTRKMMKRMKEEFEQGHSLLVFPEGTRTVNGQLGELQAGVFRVALQIGAPIVPVTVTGMYRVMRKGSYLIRPGHTVTVHCDAPIETAGLKRSDVPALMERVRGTMQGHLDRYWAESNPG
jgi:1-acyl-sn-glycerol-3-phosphate acyltransferase